jgi:hypothetical protein
MKKRCEKEIKGKSSMLMSLAAGIAFQLPAEKHTGHPLLIFMQKDMTFLTSLTCSSICKLTRDPIRRQQKKVWASSSTIFSLHCNVGEKDSCTAQKEYDTCIMVQRDQYFRKHTSHSYYLLPQIFYCAKYFTSVFFFRQYKIQ